MAAELEPSPFLTLPGAVAAPDDAADRSVAAHYGNPITEQRALHSGRAVVDLSTRGVIAVAGADRLSWLDSMTSQSLRSLRPGESAEALLLDPAGHVEHALHLLDDGEATFVLTEGSDTDAVLAFLTSMRFMLRVEPVDRTSEFATIGAFDVPDGSARAVVQPFAVVSNGIELAWRDPWPSVVEGGHQYAHAEHGHPGTDYHWVETLVPRESLAGIAAEVVSAHVAVAGTLAAEALRIAAWRPRLAAEVDDRTIPHELDWLRTAVHLDKGCYRGQETVAKVHNLGHPPRRLVFLHLDGSESAQVAPGAEVLLGDVVIGRVTSFGLHHELGPIALAVIKRSTDASAELVVRTDDTLVAAAQEAIVPPDAGAEANVPRIPRLGQVTRPSR